jgi:exoribonuclease R
LNCGACAKRIGRPEEATYFFDKPVHTKGYPHQAKSQRQLNSTPLEYSCGRRMRDRRHGIHERHAVSPIDLQATAKQVMIEHGFEPEFSPPVQQEPEKLRAHPPKVEPSLNIRDLRNLLWSSTDNDTSRDLDQAEVVERLPNGETRVLVAIADVDTFVPENSAIDQHAAKETTTVYTGVRNFPMLPEQLSPGNSSLLENADKLSIVIEFVVGSEGSVHSSSVYRAIIRNKAQLTYNAIGAWLENKREPRLKWPPQPNYNRS